MSQGTSSGSARRRHALAARWAAMPAGLCHQLQAEPESEQPEGEDLVAWSCVGGGQPVGDIAVPLYRKAELCRTKGKAKSYSHLAVRFQQGAAQGFRRETAMGRVTYGINLTGTTTTEKATEQNSISANLIRLH